MKKKNLLTLLLSLAVVLMSVLSINNNPTNMATILKPDVSAPSSGNIFVAIDGEYVTDDMNTILNRINQIRYEACKEGIKDPKTGKKLTTSDYKPLVWSSNLEEYSRLRAVEASVNWAHTRPNGLRTFDNNIVKLDGYHSAENLAYGHTLLNSIEAYYKEKAAYLGKATGQTGHYEAMIRPDYDYVSVAGFKTVNGAVFSAMEFGVNWGSNSTSKNSKTGSYTQLIEVKPSLMITSLTIEGSNEMQIGNSQKLNPIANMNSKTKQATIYSGHTWNSSNTTVATIDSNGNITAKKAGTTTITLSINGYSATKTITVKEKSTLATSVSLNKTSLTLDKGKTFTLTTTVSPSSTTNKTVYYTSGNNAVATIDQNGKVSAKGVGSTTITARTTDGSNKTATCKVTVQNVEIAATSVALNKTSLTLTVGDNANLTATVYPSTATNKTVTFTSSNTAVATVDEVGKIITKKAGTATITVKTNNGKTATCVLTVKEPTIEVTSLSLNKTTATMTVGDTTSLSTTVIPANATNKSLTYISDNVNVATVSSTGVVTAKAAGVVNITVKSNNGKTATCKITVNNKIIAVSGVSLNKTTATLNIGDVMNLTATVSPSNATDKTVTFTSSNSNIASVSSSGVVTARSAGSVTITAKTTNGKVSSCIVTVKNSEVVATGITLSRTAVSLATGETAGLTATITPTNATNKNVTYTSSNSNVASVDSYGRVTAKASGTATITARTNNNLAATCVVTVKANSSVVATGIKLNRTSVKLSVGDVVAVSATVTPTNATDKAVTYTSSNSNVASVDVYGRITAKSAGTTTITAKTNNGLSATCAVTVKSDDYVAMTSLTFNETSKALTVGDTARLVTNITPSNATDKTITFSSTNNNVVSVDGSGNITAKGAGTATVYAKSSNNLTASCYIVVEGKTVYVAGINIDDSLLTNGVLKYHPGDVVYLSAYVTPSNATNSNLKYTSKNKDVVTVEQNGAVYFANTGDTEIVIEALDGSGVKRTVQVSVAWPEAVDIDDYADSYKTSNTPGSSQAKDVYHMTIDELWDLVDTGKIPTLSQEERDYVLDKLGI